MNLEDVKKRIKSLTQDDFNAVMDKKTSVRIQILEDRKPLYFALDNLMDDIDREIDNDDK